MISIPEPLAEWLENFSALSLILTIGFTLWLIRSIWRAAKNTLPGLKKAIAFVEALFKLPEFMANSKEQMECQGRALDEVKHEVLPNNGGSMRDDLLTIGLRVEKLEALQAKDFERIKTLSTIITDRVVRAQESRAEYTKTNEEDNDREQLDSPDFK